MKEYVITVTFVNGQVMNRTTANQYFSQHLMKMFVKHDRVADVRMKIVRSKKGLDRVRLMTKSIRSTQQINDQHNNIIINNKIN